MFRLVFALVVFLVLTGFGISGWISDGWTTGLSIIVGAMSAAVYIVTCGQAVILDKAFGAVAATLLVIGFFQYLDDARRHKDESLAAYKRAYAACVRGDAKGCEGTKVFACKYMQSNEDVMRAVTSAHINSNTPKEISGVVDMQAQHDINMLPIQCQPKR